MRVIHILKELKFSGAEIMYVDAAPIFREKGCELYVVATGEKIGEYAPYFEKSGYHVLHKPYPKFLNIVARIAFIISFIKYIKKENIDVIHNHSHGTYWIMALCSWFAGKKSVYTFHSVFPTNFYSYFYHWFLRWSAKHIFNCRFQTISDSVYDNELKLYNNRTIKIYNWYGTNRFFPANVEEKRKIRLDLNITPDALVLISVGGCSPGKRHSEIIKALPEVIEYFSDTIYLHLGKGASEGEEINLTKKLGITEHVRFCENVTDVRKYLIASDIYLMPSKYEGISITTIEAMASYIPAILYDVPGLRDFNKDGENSILIPEDYRILSKKVIYLHSNPEVPKRITSKALKFVNEKFSMEKNVPQIMKLYK